MYHPDGGAHLRRGETSAGLVLLPPISQSVPEIVRDDTNSRRPGVGHQRAASPQNGIAKLSDAPNCHSSILLRALEGGRSGRPQLRR